MANPAHGEGTHVKYAGSLGLLNIRREDIVPIVCWAV